MKHLFTLLLLFPLVITAQTPQHWFGRGKTADQHRDYAGAEFCYSQAIRFGYHPLDRAYMARATARARQNKFTMAIEDYKRVIDMDKRNAKAFSNRGHTYAQVGRHRFAIMDFNEAIRLGLRDEKIFCLRGISYTAERQYEKAMEDFEESLRRDPRYAYAYFQRGLLWEELEDFKAAYRDYDMALRYDSSNEEIRDARARLIQIAGRPNADQRTRPQRYRPEYSESYSKEGETYIPREENQSWKDNWTREEQKEEEQIITRSEEIDKEKEEITSVEDDFNPYRIDGDLPRTNMSQPDAIAVVIGNKNYTQAKEVSYAHNDARLMKRYLIQVLGFKEGNIFLLEDATTSDFQVYFGTPNNHQGKLYNTVKPGKSDVFIFYSGHGAPDLKEKNAYFLPVNCDPNYVQLGGYPLDVFYKNLYQIPARTKTVVLDACFSGANIYDNLSLVRIKSDPNKLNDPRLSVLTSSTGDQASCWYNAKEQGMFTYFFLRALHDYKNSDANQNGELSFQEVYNYISDKTEGIPYYARRIHGIEQTPTLLGRNREGILLRY